MKMQLERSILFIRILSALVFPCLPSLVRGQGCTYSQGPNTAAGFSTTSLSGSSFSWSNASGAQLQDASYATAGISLGVFSTAYSNYLVAKDFGFSIPSTANICEIVVEVDRSATGLGLGGGVTDQSIRLLKAGVPAGSDQANTSTTWPSSDAIATYGNSIPTGLWGGSWLPADVNDPNFGVAISSALSTGILSLFMTARINQLRVTIHYDISVLGIPLQHFSVTKEADASRLDWTTPAAGTEEETGSPFIVQRSADSRYWQDLAIVTTTQHAANQDIATGDIITWNVADGKKVTSPGDGPSYTYTDNAPLNGPNFYRLQWQNANGQTYYSPIGQVVQGKDNIHCYPNPFTSTINISGPGPIHSLVVEDARGKTRRTIGDKETGGAYSLQLPAADLPPGLYFVRVNGSVFKLVKL